MKIDTSEKLVIHPSNILVIGIIFLIIFNCVILPIGFLMNPSTNFVGSIFCWAAIAVGVVLLIFVVYSTYKPLWIIDQASLTVRGLVLNWNDVESFHLINKSMDKGYSYPIFTDIHLNKPVGGKTLIREWNYFLPMRPGKLLNILQSYQQANGTASPHVNI